jgi:hypothetical protein
MWPGHTTWNRRIGRTAQLGQDRQVPIGHLGQDSGTRQLGQDSRDRSDWTSRPIGNLDRTARR